jgi:immune inhibitor A
MTRVALRFALVLLLICLVLPVFPGRPALVASAPSAMPPHPRLAEKIARGEVTLPRFMTDPVWARSVGLESPQGAPRQLQGSLNVLAVAIQFSDNIHTVTASYFDTLLFAAPVAGRGSVRDYYDEVSYGTVDIITVNMPSSLGWVTAPQTYAYYVGGNYCTDAPYPNNCQKLAEDVVDVINATFPALDFSVYDNDGDGSMEPIVLIHSGPGADFTGNPNDIWSHSWNMVSPRYYDGVTIGAYVIQPEYFVNVSGSTSDMSIGVFAHEMGHGFWDLPDVYDRKGDGTKTWGVGDWSLMSGGSWNGPNSGGWGTDGSSPAWPDAWCRTMMGFVTPTSIASNQTGYAIPQDYGPTSANTVLKLRSGVLGAQEYFLLENRQQVTGSYEEYLPAAGLLIWHVDEAMNTYPLCNDYECSQEPQCNCSDTQHFLLALQQADALHQLEMVIPAGNSGDAGDVFPGSANKRSWTNGTTPGSSSWYTCNNSCIGVSNISNSSATMTADLQVSCTPPPVPTHWIYLPLVMRNYSGGGGPQPTPQPTTQPTPQPTVPGGWQTIVSEDFEGAFPGSWNVFDNHAGQGEYYWAKRGCRPYAGGSSGWAVGGGANGSALTCGANYPDSAESWMTYGPFSLAGTTDAEMLMQLWANSEEDYDYLCWLASTNGTNFYGNCGSGSSGGWLAGELDLTNVPTLGDLRGQPSVWVAIVFSSDSSYNYAEGAYVDNILVRKCTDAGGCARSLGERPAVLQLPVSGR